MDRKKYLDLLHELNSSPLFKEFISDVRKERPEIPEFDPYKDNSELMKFRSGQKQGFDLAISFFTGDDDDR